MDEDQYIAFGRSRKDDKPEMMNSDVVVAYYDLDDGSFHAIDYSVTARSQCDGTFGVCPDERVNGRNDVSVIGGERRNGITSITFSRPYETNDQMDMPIPRFSDTVTIIAAIGVLNKRKEANYHDDFVTKEKVVLDFSSAGDNSCGVLVGGERDATKFPPWEIPAIRAKTNFTATIGPTGGDRGFKAITNLPTWGIAWWINDLLVPEIYVERGQTYYFTVYGGKDKLNSPRYHPLYITNSSEGGFGQKTVAEQDREHVYAGVVYSKMGNPDATAAGGLCEWRHEGIDAWEDSITFEEYKETLYKDCDGEPAGTLVWTVEEHTPDLVYYQCYTHRNLGWKIHVVDSGYNLRQEGVSSGSTLTPSHAISVVVLLLALMLPLR